MIDNTEPTIDDYLDRIAELSKLGYPDLDGACNICGVHPDTLKALIANQIREARIDELIGVRGWTEYEPDPKYSPAERFHIVPYTYLTKRIEELKRSK